MRDGFYAEFQGITGLLIKGHIKKTEGTKPLRSYGSVILTLPCESRTRSEVIV